MLCTKLHCITVFESTRFIYKILSSSGAASGYWILDSFREIRARTPNTVEQLSALGAPPPRGGPVQDPVLTSPRVRERVLVSVYLGSFAVTISIKHPPPPRKTMHT